MATKINLFVNDKSGKVHVLGRGSVTYTICGERAHGPMSVHEFSPRKNYDFGRHDWCSRCIKIIAMSIIKGHAAECFQPVLNYAFNKKSKKVKETEESYNALRAEFTFDSEEMVVALIAGVTVGDSDSLRVLVKKEIKIGWDRIESLRDLTEDAKYVEMVFHSVKR